MSPFVARLLVFGTSAAVLVLEIVAGRLMAPYIGVSLETFTGIIGVVLAGIAIGAWVGGIAADRTEPGPLIGPLIAISGVFVVLAPQAVDFFGPAMRAAGPLEIVFLTAVGFFVPSATLSAVTPVVVKMRLRSLEETGVWMRPSDYGEPYPITRNLLEDGDRWSILPGPVPVTAPVRILQGGEDPDVPWRHALELAQAINSPDVVFQLIKDGDHRLSRPQDLVRLIAAVEELVQPPA